MCYSLADTICYTVFPIPVVRNFGCTFCEMFVNGFQITDCVCESECVFADGWTRGASVGGRVPHCRFLQGRMSRNGKKAEWRAFAARNSWHCAHIGNVSQHKNENTETKISERQ